MLRLIYVVILRIGSIIHFVPKMRKYARHPEKYTDEDCHRLAQIMIEKVHKTARVHVSVHGTEHLPAQGGFILYSNHQGKNDALGIMAALPRPCRVLMDLQRSKLPLANEFVALVKGKRLDRKNLRRQVTSFREISDEVADGKVYLIFPEGGYNKRQTNVMNPFHGGCFRSAVRAKAPIVPVVLVDFWKAFGRNSLKKVESEVHFLPPIPYEEYEGMSTANLARMVQERIGRKLREVTGQDVMPPNGRKEEEIVAKALEGAPV